MKDFKIRKNFQVDDSILEAEKNINLYLLSASRSKKMVELKRKKKESRRILWELRSHKPMR